MSFFGEIVEPNSRNAWEDWDEEPMETVGKLQWQQKKPHPELMESLLIFEGKYLYDCIFKNATSNLHLINSVQEVNLHMYRITTYHKYIIVIKDYNLLQSPEIFELLKPLIIDALDVMVVQTKPLAEYQTSKDISGQTSIIRTICTTKPGAAADTPYPRLEQPNIMTGVVAGALTLREHLGQSGIAIICYVNQPDEYQDDELNTLLKQLNIDPPSPRQNNIQNSNLYI